MKLSPRESWLHTNVRQGSSGGGLDELSDVPAV